MQTARMSKAMWFLMVLLLLPLAVYAPSVVRNGFVSIDDSLLITKNAAVQELSLRSVAHVFTSYDPELYIPLTLLSYQIEWALVGAHPLLFHLTNLLLHIGSGIFLFLFLQKIFRSDVIAFFGALFFVLHPLHTEAVAWAAARKDVLSAVFFFASLYWYERWREDPATKRPWQSLLLFLFALLSKVTVAPLPVVLLLLDWRRGGVNRKTWFAMTWPYFALSVFFIVVALFGKAKGISSLGLWKTGLLSAKAVIFYLGNILWPFQLSVIYSQRTPVTLASPEFFLPVGLVLVLLGGIVLLRNRSRTASFGLAFFVLTLLPNFANFWKNQWLFFASDRYAYIPSVGLLIVLCASCSWFLRRYPARERVMAGALGTLAIAFALLTVRQSMVWHDDILLYQNVLRWYPDSALAENNLGDAYVKAGKLDVALPHFALAAESDPRYVQAMTNAGNVERERGHYDEAQQWYGRAVAAIPASPRIEDLAPHYFLGELLIGLGKADEGLAHYRTAAGLLPTVAEPYYNWGLQLQKIGRTDEAVSQFEKAIALSPGGLAARYHLAGLYAERGRLQEARAQLEYVVGVDPGYEKSAEHLVNIRRLMGE